MELCYRGTKYQTTITSVNTVASGITARFLGKTYSVRQANCPIVLQSDLYKYRGISYQRGSHICSVPVKHYPEQGEFLPTSS